MISKYNELSLKTIIKIFLNNIEQFKNDYDYIFHNDPNSYFLALYQRNMFDKEILNNKDIVLIELTSIESLLVISKKVRTRIHGRKLNNIR